jgi:hypothetical protein
MGVYEQWNNLTPAEKAVITALTLRNPAVPLIVKNSKDVAFNETTAKVIMVVMINRMLFATVFGRRLWRVI